MLSSAACHCTAAPHKLEPLLPQAISSGDPQQIRQAQLNIAQRRARGAATPGAPLFTPGGTAARLVPRATPFLPAGATPGGLAPVPEEEGEAAAGAAAAADCAPPDVSLDTFMAAHTSEDNASFGEILEDVNKRRRLRRAAAAVHQNPRLLLLGAAAGDGGGGAQVQQAQQARLLLESGREKTDGFGTTGQEPATLTTRPTHPLNALFYDSSTRDVVAYTGGVPGTGWCLGGGAGRPIAR